MTSMLLEADGESRHGELRSVSLEIKPSSEKMTTKDACLPVSDICRLQTADFRQQTADCRLQVKDCIQ